MHPIVQGHAPPGGGIRSHGGDGAVGPESGQHAGGPPRERVYADGRGVDFATGMIGGAGDGGQGIITGFKRIRIGQQIGHLAQVTLRFSRNGGHGAHGLHGVTSQGCLAGQHDRVGAVENGVGDVGRFRPGGPGLVGHALQHLGGDDDRNACPTTTADDLFLKHADPLDIHLDTQIAASDHDRVGGCQDVIEVVERLRFLDFGDDGRLSAGGIDEPTQQLHIRPLPDEAERQKISPGGQGGNGIGSVFGGHRRQAGGGSGEVDSLTFAQSAPFLNGAV